MVVGEVGGVVDTDDDDEVEVEGVGDVLLHFWFKHTKWRTIWGRGGIQIVTFHIDQGCGAGAAGASPFWSSGAGAVNLLRLRLRTKFKN